MSKRAPEYTPMCNKHIRFFLSNPHRQEFRSYIAQKQFFVVEKVFNGLTKQEQEWISLILPGDGSNDLLDSYIVRKLKENGASNKQIENFYKLLRRVNLKIAIDLGYVEDNKRSIEWTCNF